ncbi:MAG: protein kinase [Chitinophagaceae bacterium]|nr:protein kinase [Chitinophagaceae bacterium]
MDPEMIHTGRASKETDVYAFGILVLEMVCGRAPLQYIPGVVEPRNYVDDALLDKVWRAHEAGRISTVVDPRLLEQSEALKSEELVMLQIDTLHLGLRCCLPNPSERPSIQQVKHELIMIQSGKVDGAAELPRILPAANRGPHSQYRFIPRSSPTSLDVTPTHRFQKSPCRKISMVHPVAAMVYPIF